MKATLTYKNGETKISGDNLNSMSPRFRAYVEDIMSAYDVHMRSLSKNPSYRPVGKLEIELEMQKR